MNYSARRRLPRGRIARRSRGLLLGGVWLHCRTRWRARDLDHELAAGANPLGSDELSLRVGQLGSAGTRARLACALRGAVAVANGHHAPLMMTRLRCASIRENEELLFALADRVHDDGPLGVRGLAMTAELVNGRDSPLYADDPERPLTVIAFEALVHLDRGLRTAASSND